MFTNSVTLFFTDTLPQIRHIQNQNINLLHSSDATANMMISGRVSGVHRESGTFTMTVYPVIGGASANAHLEIRAVLRCNLFALNPAQRLPGLNSVVTFSGDLLTVEETVAIVSLDKITYLPHPGIFHNHVHETRVEVEAVD
jgi:hypothetical protein